MSWHEFWQRYTGFIKNQSFQYACISNVHSKSPVSFAVLYDESFIKMNRIDRPTSTLAQYAFVAKKMGLKIPEAAKNRIRSK